MSIGDFIFICFLKIPYSEVVRRNMILTEVIENVSVLTEGTKRIVSFGGENSEEFSYLHFIFFVIFFKL